MQHLTFILILWGAAMSATVYRLAERYAQVDSGRITTGKRSGHSSYGILDARTLYASEFLPMNMKIPLNASRHSIGYSGGFPFRFSEARFTNNITLRTSTNGALSPPLEGSTACWQVPEGYSPPPYPDSFVHTFNIPTLQYGKRVLLWDNGTHVLGVPNSICVKATGVPGATPYWNVRRGDFMGCTDSLKGEFLGLFCQIGREAIAKLCPSVTLLGDNACLVAGIFG